MNPPPIPDFFPQLFDWCYIPAGDVTIRYGRWNYEDGAEYQIERIENIHIPSFFMAKYPLTNAQYDVFIRDADGYQNPAWWDFSDEAKVWRTQNQNPENPYVQGNTMPRTRVSWHDCTAFCRWMSAKMGMTITLPTEGQWQRASAGDDNRAYAWGNVWDKSRCNHDSAIITPVTHYAGLGDSPFGCVDMCGNVWEWCMNRDEANEKAHIARGGSWFEDEPFWYTTHFRESLDSGILWNITGFRIALVGL